jgi:phosphoenolpyruvate carboxylase
MRSVSELRAIPNNGVLQQLGYFANTLFGVGSAAQKNLDTFQAMQADSPRFRRALEMARGAWQGSDFSIVFAYAATLEPATWLDRASRDLPGAADLQTCEVAVRAEMSDHLTRVLRRLQAEDLALRCVLDRQATARRERLLFLHALRIALIQQICLLAVRFPDFNPRGEITRASLQESLMRLDVPGALKHLETIFPLRTDGVEKADFGEPTRYDATVSHAYLKEHETVFGPLRRLYALVLAVSTAVTHEIGAVG